IRRRKSHEYRKGGSDSAFDLTNRPAAGQRIAQSLNHFLARRGLDHQAMLGEALNLIVVVLVIASDETAIDHLMELFQTPGRRKKRSDARIAIRDRGVTAHFLEHRRSEARSLQHLADILEEANIDPTIGIVKEALFHLKVAKHLVLL